MNKNTRSALIMTLVSGAVFSACLAGGESALAQQPTAASPAAVQKKPAKVKIFEVRDREAFLAKYGADKVKQLRSEEPAGVMLRLTVDAPVTDLRVLALTLKNIDKNGKAEFNEEEKILVGEVKPEDIILIDMTMIGDIPNNGISYTDTDGTVKRFSVNMSGKDGSLFLLKY